MDGVNSQASKGGVYRSSARLVIDLNNRTWEVGGGSLENLGHVRSLSLDDEYLSDRLDGQHAVVTGGGHGIGGTIARQLANSGARVTVIGRQRKYLDEIVCLIDANAIVLDVTDEESVVRGFVSLGRVDILVNSAGALRGAPLLQTELALWESMIAVNLTAVFLCCQAVASGMLGQKYGRIVNVASMAGLEPYRYVAGYVAAKHGRGGAHGVMALLPECRCRNGSGDCCFRRSIVSSHTFSFVFATVSE